MGGPRMNESQYDNVAMLKAKGLKTAEIANVMGVSYSQVNWITRANNAAEAGDTGELIRIQKFNRPMVVWACKKHGVSLGVKQEEPEVIKESKPAPDNTALAFVQLAESLRALTSAVQAIDQRLSAMQTAQSVLRGDAVDIAKEIVKAMNVNGDILTKEHERMIDLLSGIKCNTRKRGNGNDAG